MEEISYKRDLDRLQTESVEVARLGKKYVLCRPIGGFNDTLVQISWCVDYCLRFGRELVLDTSGSGLGCAFGDLFDLEIFPVPTKDISMSIARELNQLATWPASVEGRIDTYQDIGLTGQIGRFELNSLQKISFWDGVDYAQDLVVHHGGGGGSSSKRILPFLRLRPSVAIRVLEGLRDLPDKFDAIHIRNTDYLSPWRELLSKAMKLTSPRLVLLVFSDDPLVLSAVLSIGESCAPAPIHRSELVRGPLHKQVELGPDARRELAIEMLTELVAMCLASSFNYSRTRGRNGSPKSPVSGFSTLVVSCRLLLAKRGLLGLETSISNEGPSRNRRIWLIREELLALTKFLGFYLSRARSALGRHLGR